MSRRDDAPNGPRREFSLPRAAQRLDAELDDEFRFHFDERVDEFVAAGMSREEALREVTRRFGDREAYKASARAIDTVTLKQERRAAWTRTLAREAQRAVRVLTRDRGFSLVAFFTLALGLGATISIFTVLDRVVLRALPYRDADRLVSVMHPATVPGSGERHWGLSEGSYFGFRERMRTLEDLGMYSTGGFTVTSGGDAELVQVASVTSTLFTTLQARAALGRLILAEDDAPGGPSRVVLSHEFWQRRFGGNPAVIGQNLETSVGSYEIIGVAEPSLALPMPGPFASSSNLSGFTMDVWVPMQANPAGPFYNSHPYVGVGRLREGVTAEDAQREFTGLFAQIAEALPDVYSPGFLKQYRFGIAVRPLRDAVLGPAVPRALWLLFAAVILVLVIAAANVGNLFLLRFEARRREAAIRSALGAGRGQMAAHYLAETLLLCGAAWVAGVGLAALALQGLLRIAPPNIPRLGEVALGARAVGVGLLFALGLALVLGFVPLLRRGLDLGSLRDGGRGLSPSRRSRVVRHALVVGQLALTLVLLAGAGLMFRSFAKLRAVEPGFDARGVLAFDVSLPFLRYDTREKAAVFHEELQRRLAALPGVQAVGAGPTPLVDFGTGCAVVFREARPYGVDEQTPCVASSTAVPGYFEALGITVEGRTPEWRDVTSRSQAVVITQALAERLWPGESAIDKGLGNNGSNAPAFYRVVGVIPSLRAEALDLPPTEAVFYAATGLTPNQRSGALNDLTVFVRQSGVDPYALVPAIRQTLRELDAQVPLVNPRAMETVLARSMARTSFLLTLLGIASLVALVLSAVGIYGVISYLVAQRRTEIGIRLALGASVGGVVRLIVLQAAQLAAVGVLIGVAAALVGSRVMQSLLYEVQAGDPRVLAGGTLLVLAVVTLASWGPARRAARVDPAEAMRAD